jgi:hypothetical protein
MGYYTRMEFCWVVIKRSYVGVVKNAILGKNRKTHEFQYMLKHLEIDADGWLDWNREGSTDYSCNKHYKDKELADWLSKYCDGGFLVSWSLEGDGANWAYEFDGKGGVSACSARRPAAIFGWMKRRNREVVSPDP